MQLKQQGKPVRSAREPQKRSRRIPWALVLCVLALGLWLWPRHGKESAPEASRLDPSALARPLAIHSLTKPAAQARASHDKHSTVTREPEAELQGLAVVRAPLIAAVRVEKSEVCHGEDLKISIAPLPGAEAASFNIEGKFGNELVVTASMPTEESFWIVGSQGAKRDFREVKVRVLPEDHARCARASAAEIIVQGDPWRRDDYHFELVPMRNLGDLVQVRWSFGDGHASASGARVTHSFGDRPQNGPFATFLVTANAVDAEGHEARTRVSVTLPNLHYQARALSGYRELPVEYARVTPPSTDRVEVRFNNIETLPVRFEHAHVRLSSCTGMVRDEDVAAHSLFDVSDLPAGQLSESRIVLASHWTTPDICRVELSLRGDTVPPTTDEVSSDNGIPNQPVTAHLTFQLGVPKTVAAGGAPSSASRPVTDPALEARLLELMANTGTNYATQEDLDQAARSED